MYAHTYLNVYVDEYNYWRFVKISWLFCEITQGRPLILYTREKQRRLDRRSCSKESWERGFISTSLAVFVRLTFVIYDRKLPNKNTFYKNIHTYVCKAIDQKHIQYQILFQLLITSG